jgi:hypothetical protein
MDGYCLFGSHYVENIWRKAFLFAGNSVVAHIYLHLADYLILNGFNSL